MRNNQFIIGHKSYFLVYHRKISAELHFDEFNVNLTFSFGTGQEKLRSIKDWSEWGSCASLTWFLSEACDTTKQKNPE